MCILLVVGWFLLCPIVTPSLFHNSRFYLLISTLGILDEVPVEDPEVLEGSLPALSPSKGSKGWLFTDFMLPSVICHLIIAAICHLPSVV
jgi:hypothetical protein